MHGGGAEAGSVVNLSTEVGDAQSATLPLEERPSSKALRPGATVSVTGAGSAQGDQWGGSDLFELAAKDAVRFKGILEFFVKDDRRRPPPQSEHASLCDLGLVNAQSDN